MEGKPTYKVQKRYWKKYWSACPKNNHEDGRIGPVSQTLLPAVKRTYFFETPVPAHPEEGLEVSFVTAFSSFLELREWAPHLEDTTFYWGFSSSSRRKIVNSTRTYWKHSIVGHGNERRAISEMELEGSGNPFARRRNISKFETSLDKCYQIWRILKLFLCTEMRYVRTVLIWMHCKPIIKRMVSRKPPFLRQQLWEIFAGY